MTLDLFDYQAPPHIPHAAGSSTSREAAESIVPVLGNLEAKVLAAVKAAGTRGLVCDEAEQITGLSHQCCSARFRGLEQRGYLRRTEDRRLTRSGRAASVYVIVERAA